MFLGWLWPGTVHAALGAEDDVLRVVWPLRAEQPDMAIHVRGDCGFGLPKMYQVCEDQQLTDTFGLATNNRLKALTTDLVARAAQLYEETGEKRRLFAHFEYSSRFTSRVQGEGRQECLLHWSVAQTFLSVRTEDRL